MSSRGISRPPFSMDIAYRKPPPAQEIPCDGLSAAMSGMSITLSPQSPSHPVYARHDQAAHQSSGGSAVPARAAGYQAYALSHSQDGLPPPIPLGSKPTTRQYETAPSPLHRELQQQHDLRSSFSPQPQAGQHVYPSPTPTPAASPPLYPESMTPTTSTACAHNHQPHAATSLYFSSNSNSSPSPTYAQPSPATGSPLYPAPAVSTAHSGTPSPQPPSYSPGVHETSGGPRNSPYQALPAHRVQVVPTTQGQTDHAAGGNPGQRRDPAPTQATPQLAYATYHPQPPPGTGSQDQPAAQPHKPYNPSDPQHPPTILSFAAPPPNNTAATQPTQQAKKKPGFFLDKVSNSQVASVGVGFTTAILAPDGKQKLGNWAKSKMNSVAGTMGYAPVAVGPGIHPQASIGGRPVPAGARPLPPSARPTAPGLRPMGPGPTMRPPGGPGPRPTGPGQRSGALPRMAAAIIGAGVGIAASGAAVQSRNGAEDTVYGENTASGDPYAQQQVWSGEGTTHSEYANVDSSATIAPDGTFASGGQATETVYADTSYANVSTDTSVTVTQDTYVNFPYTDSRADQGYVPAETPISQDAVYNGSAAGQPFAPADTGYTGTSNDHVIDAAASNETTVYTETTAYADPGMYVDSTAYVEAGYVDSGGYGGDAHGGFAAYESTEDLAVDSGGYDFLGAMTAGLGGDYGLI